ncbi:MAG: hypothetical protein DRP08_03480 [Candidatus Aenigmatarchaeota archaeon]|nr:MAG: hypothetical protein DRP08_03480 [Candidatus Aenigmarchaeota archaeon]
MKKRPYTINATHNRGRNVKREPDFEYDGVKYWWREMTSQSNNYQPLKIKYIDDLYIIVFMDGGWGVEAPRAVVEQYKYFHCERHLLEDTSDR